MIAITGRRILTNVSRNQGFEKDELGGYQATVMVVSPGFEGRGVGPLFGSDSNVRTCTLRERVRVKGDGKRPVSRRKL